MANADSELSELTRVVSDKGFRGVSYSRRLGRQIRNRSYWAKVVTGWIYELTRYAWQVGTGKSRNRVATRST